MNTFKPTDKFIENTILISTICLLFGRAWQFIFWDAPLRALFWDERLMSKIVVPHFFESWHSYATNLQVDTFITNTKTTIGFIFFATALLLLLSFWHKTKILRYFLWVSFFFLCVLTILLWKEKFYQIGQLIEYSSQLIAPLLALYILNGRFQINQFIVPIKIAIAFTFIGHGLYAFGFHPQPGHFVDMMISVFAINEDTARFTLKVVGVLDFIAPVALFFSKTFKPAIWYIMIWAVMTSFARIVANLDATFILSSFSQWSFEVLIRVPHFMLPIALWMIYKQKDSAINFNNNFFTKQKKQQINRGISV